MDINNTRKVINSILQDKVTAEDCRKALSELDAMVQAKSDLTGVNAVLEKTRDALKAEVAALNGKIQEAQAKAADILAEAEADAKGAIAAAADNIEAMQHKADAKLAAMNERISNAETTAILKEATAREAQAKLDEITKELDAAKARLQKMIG